jgi:adenylate kinase
VSELNILLLGPPGAGKGTQAARLAEDFGLQYIATGNMLRERVREGTDLSRKAKEYMDRGDLVPDDLIIAMIKESLEHDDRANGFILDGFPRTERQAQALDEELEQLGRILNAALLIDVDEQDVLNRLSQRRVCVKAQHNFHMSFDPPKHPERCDIDGSRLVQRDDDKPEVIQHRLREYREKTAPLIGYYERQGRLRRVDGSRSPDEVGDQIRATLAALKLEERLPSAGKPADGWG